MSNLSISGISLRDYFAIEILNGFISDRNQYTSLLEDARQMQYNVNRYLAKESYALADAMLAEKSRTEKLNAKK